MEKIIELNALSFAYPNSNRAALKNISLSVERGEFVTLIGSSGCGKSTLLRNLKPSIRPHGKLDGTVCFMGADINTLDTRYECAQIGFVAQNPDNAIVTDKVWHELVFTLESLGVPNGEMRRKAAEISAFFGIDKWYHKSVSELSGGQKQLLCLAAVMISEPELLILDEPTSQLDPIAAQGFISALHRVNKELGTTVIICEHRLEELLALSDKVAVMDKGELVAFGDVEQTARTLKESRKSKMFRAMPTPMRVFAAADGQGKYPVTVAQGRAWLREYGERHGFSELSELKAQRDREISTQSVITLKDIWFRYAKNGTDILKGVNLDVKQGEIFAILGSNGAGKSTSLSIINGTNKPYKGKVQIAEGKRLVSMPQEVGLMFECESVAAELKAVGADADRVLCVTQFCRLATLYEKHPYDLSGGEQQRLALAKLLLCEPDIIVLDEPTKGLDAEFKHCLSKMLKSLSKHGLTVLMVSHDVEFCAESADRCAMFFDGELLGAARTREFFMGNSFYVSAAQRMAKGITENVVLSAKELTELCGAHEEDDEDDEDTDDDDAAQLMKRGKAKAKDAPETERFGLLKRLFKNSELKIKPIKQEKSVSLWLLPLIIAMTVLIGRKLGGDRRYYVVSLCIIAETIGAFVLSFERRKPRTREIVVLAVMSALAVVSRTAFYMVAQVKPMAALVMLAGVAFGARSGFLVGAVAAFGSNFFFGQGPWTPWQMLAFGLLGYAAGLIFARCKFKRFSVAAVGAVLTFVVYGAVMNLSSLLMYQSTITWEMLVSTYALGVPFDAVHAAGTFLFLYFGAIPLMRKLERVKQKYGMCI